MENIYNSVFPWSSLGVHCPELALQQVRFTSFLKKEMKIGTQTFISKGFEFPVILPELGSQYFNYLIGQFEEVPQRTFWVHCVAETYFPLDNQNELSYASGQQTH